MTRRLSSDRKCPKIRWGYGDDGDDGDDDDDDDDGGGGDDDMGRE